jgi:ribosome-associated toxin RatA of RatAB toxin-antitoxin module
MAESCSHITINRGVRRVYDVAQTYPTFVTFFSKKQVVSADETQLSVRAGMKRYGINFEWAGIGKKIPYESINFVQTEGLIKGLRARWKFQNITPESTLVEIRTSFQLNLLLFNSSIEKGLSSILVENTTRRILNDLKLACETGGA